MEKFCNKWPFILDDSFVLNGLAKEKSSLSNGSFRAKGKIFIKIEKNSIEIVKFFICSCL